VGHELYHKRYWVHKAFGILAYVKFYYSHMYTAHVKLHHKLAATREDASTSRMNESLYTYLARAIPGCVTGTWSYKPEKDSFGNEMLKHIFYSAVLFTVII
jgi:alkane 1-monooxygenase